MTTRNAIISGVGILIIAGAAVGGWYYFAGSPAAPQASVAALVGSVTETVTLSGQVQASEGVDLAFESSGKVTANYVKVGQSIYAGQSLMAIDDSNLQAQLNQAQAQLAELDINTVNSQNTATLQSLYANSLSQSQQSLIVAQQSLFTATNIQYAHFINQDPTGIAIANVKAIAVQELLGEAADGQSSVQYLAGLKGGTFGEAQAVVQNPTQPATDQVLADTLTSLQDIRTLLNTIPLDQTMTSSDLANLATAQANIAREISTTTANIQAISTAKVNNGAKVTTTNAQVAAAEANIAAIKTQIGNTVIVAPVSGKVDKDDVTVGQFATAGSPVITISNNNLEIDTNIPEVDLAKVTAGRTAQVTLDAFGTGKTFAATVVSVDSAPTMANGISVYAAKLKFNSAQNGVEPGMTANITIVGDTHKNAVLVPNTAIIQEDANMYVMVDDGNGKTHLQQVQVGLRGDTNAEITSGISAGQNVIAY